MTEFIGFDEPRENWSRLPHTLVGAFSMIKTVAELKVILYILRHTWGYGDEQKRITIDEFVHGRKRRDGSRIDNGIGMSKNAVKDGIKSAVKDGFVCVEVDDSDRGRTKQYYSLRLRGSKTDPQGVKDCPSEGQKLTPRGSKTDPRSEKETIERNLERNQKKNTNTAADAAPEPYGPDDEGLENQAESKPEESVESLGLEERSCESESPPDSGKRVRERVNPPGLEGREGRPPPSKPKKSPKPDPPLLALTATPARRVLQAKLRAYVCEPQGRRAPAKFGDLLAARKFDEHATRLGDSLEQAIDDAIRAQCHSVVAVTNYVAKWSAEKRTRGGSYNDRIPKYEVASASDF